MEPKIWIDIHCSRCEQPVRIGVQSLESAEMVKAEPYVCCVCYSKQRIAANMESFREATATASRGLKVLGRAMQETAEMMKAAREKREADKGRGGQAA